MVDQDNRSTQFPMFVVWDRVARVVPDGFGKPTRIDLDAIGEDDFCEKCYDLVENNLSNKLPDWCEECSSDCFMDVTNEFEANLKAGVFFTAEACQKHIDENSYHYSKDVTTYGIGSWRNEEMQSVMKHLIVDVAHQKLPSHYK